MEMVEQRGPEGGMAAVASGGRGRGEERKNNSLPDASRAIVRARTTMRQNRFRGYRVRYFKSFYSPIERATVKFQVNGTRTRFTALINPRP